MPSKKYSTVIFTEIGSYLYHYLPELMAMPQYEITCIYFSNHSKQLVDRFLALPALKRKKHVLSLQYHGKKKQAKVYGYLNKHKNNIRFYDPANFTPVPCDYLCSLGFMRLIPASQIAVSSSSSNIHWSLLPNYAGCAPFYWAIRNNEIESGITIHQVSEQFDAGKVLLQERIAIAPTDNVNAFRKNAARISIEAFRQYLGNKAHYDANATPQIGNYQFFNAPQSNDYALTANDTAEELLQKFRAGTTACFVQHHGTERHVVHLSIAPSDAHLEYESIVLNGCHIYLQ